MTTIWHLIHSHPALAVPYFAITFTTYLALEKAAVNVWWWLHSAPECWEVRR